MWRWVGLLGLVAVNAQAELKNTCGVLETARKAKYCITRETLSSSPDVIYFFHGMNQSERYWFDNMKNVYEIFTEGNIQPPTVISVSYGKDWLVTERNESRYSGLYEELMVDVFPQVETLSGFDATRGQRILIAASMGGFNGVQIFLRQQSFFSRAAFVCPAFSTIGPQASRREVWDYISRTNANPFLVDIGLRIARRHFPEVSDWEEHSPIQLARSRINSSTPPFHISCGKQDEFGFFEGVSQFAEIAMELNPSVIWQPLDGGHCDFKIKDIFAFLWSLV